MISTLKDYAMANYETGGHWIVETYSDSDYQRVIDAAGGDVKKAGAALKSEWDFLTTRENECGDY
jgi:hypothetical protein